MEHFITYLLFNPRVVHITIWVFEYYNSEKPIWSLGYINYTKCITCDSYLIMTSRVNWDYWVCICLLKNKMRIVWLHSVMPLAIVYHACSCGPYKLSVLHGNFCDFYTFLAIFLGLWIYAYLLRSSSCAPPLLSSSCNHLLHLPSYLPSGPHQLRVSN
jgi:hypothetical protein